MESLSPLVNHRFASGPTAIPTGARVLVNVETDPDVVIRPIACFATSVNHRLPSGPAVIPQGPPIDGSVKFDTTPAGVMRPIEPLP